MLVQVGVVQQVGVVANQVHKLHYNLSNKLNDMHQESGTAVAVSDHKHILLAKFRYIIYSK